MGEDDFGAVANADVFAGFLALSGGRTFGGLPWTPSVDGIFYYGSSETSQPFGNGFRCIGGSTFRLPILQIDIFGFASYDIDFNNLPSGGGISGGDTVKFQFWFRDPAGGGAAYNLSDGLSATFCP